MEYRGTDTVSVIGGSNKRGVGERRVKNKWIPHPVHLDPSPYEVVANLTLYKDFLKYYSDVTDDERHRKFFKEKYDIGLIKLNKPFPRHQLDGRHYIINTICLPTPDPEANDNTWSTFFGFGTIESDIPVSASYHDYLLKGDVWLQQYSANVH